MIELVEQEFREYAITTSINIAGCQFYNMNNVAVLKSDPQWYEKLDMYLNKHLLIENIMFAYTVYHDYYIAYDAHHTGV